MSLSTVCRKVSVGSFVSVCLQSRARYLPTCIIVLLAMTALGTPLFAAPVLVDQVGGFGSPTRVALTSQGDIYVADHDRGVVVVLDHTGKRVGRMTGFKAPLGLAVFEPPTELSMNDKCKEKEKEKDKEKYECITPPPMIFVGDEGDGSVRIFQEGVAKGTLGIGSGEFGKPNGIAVARAPDGNLAYVYVVDSKIGKVRVYDEQGNFTFEFGDSFNGGADKLNFPTDIVVNETAGENGEVYVSDFTGDVGFFGRTIEGRIVVFDLAGNWLHTILPPGNPHFPEYNPIFFRPAGLGRDPAGNLYVVDNTLSCVVIINPAIIDANNRGTLIDAIGVRGTMNPEHPERGLYLTGELVLPIDAAADGERIYVTSNRQRLLAVFEVIE